MSMPQELKKNTFEVNSQNIKQDIDKQVTFVLVIKLQKYIFEQIIRIILTRNLYFLKPYYDGNIHTYVTS